MGTSTKLKFSSEGIVLADPQMKSNPYELYRQLRAESPVCRVKFTEQSSYAWLITRYDDVISVLRDPRIANDRRNIPSSKQSVRLRVLYKVFGPVIFNMLTSDEPNHTRLRGLVHKAFTQKRVEELRARVESLTNELAHALREKQTWDVVGDYALPIPTTIIAEMLGVPSADRKRFKRWSDSLLLSSATSWTGMIRNVPMFMAFLRYIRGLVKARRKNPQDDLISALVLAEEAGDKLTEDELVSMIFLLLIAGYETTVNLIGNGTLALLENPEQLEKLRANPGLAVPAVEEFLRYYSPLDYTQSRGARTDITIAGSTIRAGDIIVAAIGSANRDELQFTNPDVMDITRDPNRHIAFGQGIHYCLGAFLARMEAQIAFRTIVEHFPDLRLAVARDTLQWRKSMLIRGLEELPVKGSA